MLVFYFSKSVWKAGRIFKDRDDRAGTIPGKKRVTLFKEQKENNAKLEHQTLHNKLVGSIK